MINSEMSKSIANKIPAEVKQELARLQEYEVLSDATLCGGAIRDLYLGGMVSDWDIFVVIGSGDHDAVSNLFYAANAQGYEVQHAHANGYIEGSDGFIADFRKDDFNLIVYATSDHEDVLDLVNRFDLNINAWAYVPTDEDYPIQNTADWDDSQPVEALDTSRDIRALVRVPKFKSKYPTLDWSSLDA